ncbi:hypothetical protein KIN20_007324 [Parelaphostrongylus tenuis]|uniref:Uncharacterized protein n=1 Tax=Parelaphostrongylus tenuis TaxID=148309 RepID=A0AAD5M6C0_PARTN|nr:hypothetical protein KIN20_007324 [Parelaphostrongylus tenuis]
MVDVSGLFNTYKDEEDNLVRMETTAIMEDEFSNPCLIQSKLVSLRKHNNTVFRISELWRSKIRSICRWIERSQKSGRKMNDWKAEYAIEEAFRQPNLLEYHALLAQ